MIRRVAILFAFCLLSSPFALLAEEKPKNPETSWVTLGEGIGLHETLQTALVVRPELSWLSIDASVGMFLVFTMNFRAGISLYLNSDFLSPTSKPSDAAILHFDFGSKLGFGMSCLDSAPPQCSPPKTEKILNLSTGYSWLWESYELRTMVGADYRWGKLPSPEEDRVYFSGNWAPTAMVTLGWRL